ncbi:MAG: GNAT family N-acetyltransferase [Candidatus Thorarchaeota archaeon]
MRVRFMENEDIDFALQLTSSEGWSDIRSDFEMLISHSPQAAFIALENGQSIGMISAVAYGTIGFIGSLIVLKDHRKKGIGTTLMKHAISYLESNQAMTMMLDAVPDAAPIYEGLGFKRCCKSLRLSGIPDATEVRNVRKATDDDLEGLLRLDERAFAGNRSHFLKHRYREFPDLCYVIDSGEDRVDGFIMASDRGSTVRIAPWIISNHHENAGDLINAVARARKSQSLSIGVLETNQNALDTLNRVGLHEKFFSIRMVRSRMEMPSFSNMMYSIGSPAKG